MRFINAVALSFCLFERSLAIPWVEPLPTPQGYLRQAGVSPRPTEAPGLNGIPNELLRRQEDIIYPPPAGWCGFITGDYRSLFRRESVKIGLENSSILHPSLYI
ncbi:MAG: hypothetical protein Q9204_005911 [Flavoplaca sp. TL-2023a]